MEWVSQFLTKRKFILFLAVSFLFVPAFACAQETEKVPMWPENNKEVEPSNEGPPYGTVLMMQKPITCNNTVVLENYIENMSGMMPITFGTSINQMGAITSLIQVYANPVNNQFAVVEHFATRKSCILTQGHNFEMLVQTPSAVN
tara:strand:+ start:734 stop:1168 length:435 start_codon:yes stop_codon:yes gene_type:complete